MATGLKETQRGLCEIMIKGSDLNKWGIDVSDAAWLLRLPTKLVGVFLQSLGFHTWPHICEARPLCSLPPLPGRKT